MSKTVHAPLLVVISCHNRHRILQTENHPSSSSIVANILATANCRVFLQSTVIALDSLTCNKNQFAFKILAFREGMGPRCVLSPPQVDVLYYRLPTFSCQPGHAATIEIVNMAKHAFHLCMNTRGT